MNAEWSIWEGPYQEVALAWLAGLYEGEGTIVSNKRENGRRHLQLRIVMKDEDVIRRCAAVTEMGHISPMPRRREHWSDMWGWTVSTAEDVYSLTTALMPLLGLRRQEQAARALGAWVESQRRQPPTEEERFWSHVDRGPECWVWTAKRDRFGFGTWTKTPDQRVQCHRYATQLVTGEVPPRLRNRCGNKACVRPDHWERDRKSIPLRARDES